MSAFRCGGGKRWRKKALANHVAPAVAKAPSGADWELRDAVLSAVQSLPEPSRTIVILRMLDGMSGGDVSEALECSESYVSRHCIAQWTTS